MKTSFARRSTAAALALVLSVVMSSVWAQETSPEKKPSRRPGGFPGSLPGSDTPWPDPPSDDAPATPAPPPSAPTREAAVAAEIARLRQLIAMREPLTPATITPLPSAERVLSLVRAYERRLDQMTRTLFVPAPPKFVERVTAFQARWDGIAAAIRGGQKPADIDRTTWDRIASGLSGPACAQAAQLPGGRVTVDGGRWACLSDNFFREQAELEAEAQGNVQRSRQKALAPLEKEMAAVRERLQWLREHATVIGPEQAVWLRDMTARLNKAFVEGAKARLAELTALNGAAGQSAAYREFLGALAGNVAMRATVPLPSTGPLPARVHVPAGTTLETVLDGARARAVVADVATAAQLERLARELAVVHHGLRGVERRVDRELRDELQLDRQDLERADIASGDVDLTDPAKAAARRQALERRAKELREKVRAARIASDTQRLEGLRQKLLRELAAAAP